VAISKTWRHGGSSAGIPTVDINYGLAPDTQLSLWPGYSHEKSETGNVSRIDDTELGIKYKFIQIGDEEDKDSVSFMASIYPITMLPTGDKKLGSNRNKWETMLPVWGQINYGRWESYGGVSYNINKGPDSKDSVYVGAVLTYDFTEALSLGGELFHETATEIGGRGSAGFNLGGNYKLGNYGLTDDYILLFTAGKGISNVSENTFSTFLALQVLYR
jgi:hypothetical protein